MKFKVGDRVIIVKDFGEIPKLLSQGVYTVSFSEDKFIRLEETKFHSWSVERFEHYSALMMELI